MRVWLSTTQIVLVILLLCECSGCQRRAVPKAKRPAPAQSGAAQEQVSKRNSDATFPLSILQVSGESEPAPVEKSGEKGTANRLSQETSPYLLQHAHNPVHWYAWGPEAFEAAKRENKPIFLSVGYSSCYWCHVMERLVFTNADIAKKMNEQFINVKVDREERPDVDDIYMTSLHVYMALSGQGGSGGWPLSMFLTPDGQPIAGGTYFPPEDIGQQPGFKRICELVSDAWKDRRADVLKNATTLSDVVRREMRPRFALEKTDINAELVNVMTRSIVQAHDVEFGGVDFSLERPDAPKFPSATKLALLQHAVTEFNDTAAAKVLYHTLDAMTAGGIRDHLGGGFHRYATDRRWALPHFEKMLTDNALLLDVYLEAYRATNKSLYREVVDDIIGFLFTQMTAPEGGFYSSLDAESEGIEGKYYAWSFDEVQRLLGPDMGLFRKAYDFEGEPTFEHGFVVRIRKPIDALSVEERIPPRELSLRLFDLRRKLLIARRERTAPSKDDKIITSWNGLAIRAMANAAALTSRKEVLESAERAAMVVLTKMRDSKGRLMRTYRSEQARHGAYLEDYALLIDGLLTLHLTTRDPKWLNASRHLMDDQIKLFWDEKEHGFFFTAVDHEQLLTRYKDGVDTALPSANSVSVRNLIRLASLTGEESYRDKARQTVELFATQMKKLPRSSASMALAASELLLNRDYRSITDRAKPKVQQPRETNVSDEPNSEPTSPPQPPKTNRKIEPQSAEFPAKPNRSTDEPAPASAVTKDPATNDLPAQSLESKEVVSVGAFLSTTKLVPGEVTRLALRFQIQPGWHINANPPVSKSGIPTAVVLKSKLGTAIKAIQYPEGDEIAAEGTPSQRVYANEVFIIAEMAVPEAAAGMTEEFELHVRFQACNDQNCLPPRTLKFASKAAIADIAEEVDETNGKIFNRAASKK